MKLISLWTVLCCFSCLLWSLSSCWIRSSFSSRNVSNCPFVNCCWSDSSCNNVDNCCLLTDGYITIYVSIVYENWYILYKPDIPQQGPIVVYCLCVWLFQVNQADLEEIFHSNIQLHHMSTSTSQDQYFEPKSAQLCKH